MYRRSYNRAVLRARITTVTPLRIGAGDISLDPSGADLTCVRTHHAVHGTTVYIPGSSLKGVIRAAAEASVRGQRFAGRTGACDDPLDPSKSCIARLSSNSRATAKDTPTHEIYKAHCLACRLFGSQQLKGRASLRDLFPWSDDPGVDAAFAPCGKNQVSANRLELRHGVAIDRILGSVKHGPFDQELVPAGIAFFGELALENYQLWQLGLLAVAFDQLNSGIAQLGSGKSRGLGVVRIVIEEIIHEQAGRESHPCGVGALATPEECKAYDLSAEPTLPAVEGVPHGLATRFIVRGDAEAWLAAAHNALGGLS